MGDGNDLRFWDGELLLHVALTEMRMSHWVRTPKAVEGGTGRTVFDLWPGGVWDLFATREEEDRLLLDLRRYPDGQASSVLEVRRHTLEMSVDGKPVTAQGLERALAAARRVRTGS